MRQECNVNELVIDHSSRSYDKGDPNVRYRMADRGELLIRDDLLEAEYDHNLSVKVWDAATKKSKNVGKLPLPTFNALNDARGDNSFS